MTHNPKSLQSLSDSLREAIVDSRLSHAAIAEATGVDRASISRFVARERSIRLDVADRIAEFFGLALTRGSNMTIVRNRNVFVISAASQAAQGHYATTMANGMSLAQIVGFVSAPEQLLNLRESYPDGIAYLWGGRSGGPDEGYWRQMSPGDLVLCYRNRTITSYSYVVDKVKSVQLSRLAWPDEQVRPFDLVFFLSEPQPIQKPIAQLSKYLGEIYQGLRRVAATDEIVRDYGSLEEFVEKALK